MNQMNDERPGGRGTSNPKYYQNTVGTGTDLDRLATRSREFERSELRDGTLAPRFLARAAGFPTACLTD